MDRNHLLSSALTLLVSYNSSLFRQVEQYLSRNRTDEELKTKSQCLLLFVLRKALESMVNTFDAADLTFNEHGPAKCGINTVRDGFRIMLDNYIPEDLSNVGSCKDFDMIAGFQRAAQGNLEPKGRFLLPSLVNY